MPRPIVIVHGYSDKGESFQVWKDILTQQLGYNADEVHVCSYRSLTNEISINDIAEGDASSRWSAPSIRCMTTPLRCAASWSDAPSAKWW
jgi:hypothetical protein